jgi:hypothetical protein
MGFVDDSSLKQNETFRGVRVFPPETANNIVYDAAIIASFRHAERIRQRALALNLKSVLIFRIANDGKVSLAPSESLPNI